MIGNLDRETKGFPGRAAPVMIPFFGFALGAGLDPGQVWRAGLLGIFLGGAVVVITGSAPVFADRLSGGTGVGGIAAACSAGNAAGVPAIVARANPAYRPAAAAATVQVASRVVVTAIMVPLITAWWAGHFGHITEDPLDKRRKRSPVRKEA